MIAPTTHDSPDLTAFLKGQEWYDNHRIEIVLACKRKAYWHLVGPQLVSRVDPALVGPGPGPERVQLAPLALPVGDGADFGTCVHAAIATYRFWWGKLPEGSVADFDAETRRGKAFLAFEAEHMKLFPHGPKLRTHTEEAGLAMLDAYFDRYLPEEGLFKPIDPEMGFAVLIAPRSEEPYFEKFWFRGRIDGIDERLSAGDWAVREIKTTGSGAARRLKSLGISRQPIGYVWAAREAVKAIGEDPYKITGFLGDVLLTAIPKTKAERFARDYFPVSIRATESWRRQTIDIVEEWRGRLAQYHKKKGDGPPAYFENVFTDYESLFYQTTEECFKYGQCPYYELCQYGPNPSTLSEFAFDDWDPLARKTEKSLIVTNEDEHYE